jgi:hypothetical protein
MEPTAYEVNHQQITQESTGYQVAHVTPTPATYDNDRDKLTGLIADAGFIPQILGIHIIEKEKDKPREIA